MSPLGPEVSPGAPGCCGKSGDAGDTCPMCRLGTHPHRFLGRLRAEGSPMPNGAPLPEPSRLREAGARRLASRPRDRALDLGTPGGGGPEDGAGKLAPKPTKGLRTCIARSSASIDATRQVAPQAEPTRAQGRDSEPDSDPVVWGPPCVMWRRWHRSSSNPELCDWENSSDRHRAAA